MLRAHNKWFLAVLSSPCRCHMVQSSSSGGGVSVSFPVQLNETPILSRYLYVWVMRWNPVCVKPTHTGLYSKWSSFATLHSKRNLVNSLLRHAYNIASSYQLVHWEFMNIKRMLSRSGYPDKFLDRCIQQFLNKKYVVTQQRCTGWSLSSTQICFITTTVFGFYI